MNFIDKIWPPRSIVTRLTTWYAISIFFILLISTGILYFSLHQILTSEDNAILRDRVEAINNLLRNKGNSLEALKQRVELEWATRRSEHIYVKIIGEKDMTLVASPQIPDAVETSIFSKLMSQEDAIPAKHFKLANGESYLVMKSHLNSLEAKVHPILLIALDLRVEDEILERYQRIFLAVLVFGVVLAFGLGIRLAHLSFAPVQKIVDSTRAIRSSSLHERISEKNLPSELKNLTETINEMLDRLEDSFSRLSQFSSDIAHELRTPLNNIQGEIGVLLNQERSVKDYQDVVISVQEEIIRISKMIDSLLFVAKSENPERQILKEKFKLKDEVSNILDFYAASADDEEIKISLTIDEQVSLYAEKTLFQRALSNLLANSINYTPKGGTIVVSGFQNTKEIRIVVKDSGKGIAPEALPLVFERFYRADPSRTATKHGGFGLGLTLVKTIMALHQGDVLINSTLGKGTEVTLIFPQG
jgi:two-component system heavy metal sensor histidine kinase CusS